MAQFLRSWRCMIWLAALTLCGCPPERVPPGPQPASGSLVDGNARVAWASEQARGQPPVSDIDLRTRSVLWRLNYDGAVTEPPVPRGDELIVQINRESRYEGQRHIFGSHPGERESSVPPATLIVDAHTGRVRRILPVEILELGETCAWTHDWKVIDLHDGRCLADVPTQRCCSRIMLGPDLLGFVDAGRLSAIDMRTATERWTVPLPTSVLPPRGSPEGPWPSTRAISGHHCLIDLVNRTANNAWLVDVADGKTLWAGKFEGAIMEQTSEKVLTTDAYTAGATWRELNLETGVWRVVSAPPGWVGVIAYLDSSPFQRFVVTRERIVVVLNPKPAFGQYPARPLTVLGFDRQHGNLVWKRAIGELYSEKFAPNGTLSPCAHDERFILWRVENQNLFAMDGDTGEKIELHP